MTALRQPLVTVLLTAFNGAAFIGEAIQSVRDQTCTDWELLIVDDGSTDGTRGIVAGLATVDSRIKLHSLPQNIGMAAALNVGLDLATGAYIARLDQDDLALPERLAAQVRFLENNPQFIACGTWVQQIGSSSAILSWPTDPDECSCELLFGPAILDSSMMLRGSTFRALGVRYQPEFEMVEDYDLQARLAEHAPLGNLPRVLCNYRVHSGQVSIARAVELVTAAERLHRRLLVELGLTPSSDDLALHLALLRATPVDDAFIRRADRWLRLLLVANRRSRKYPPASLRRVVGRYWMATVRRTGGTLAGRAWRLFASPLAVTVDLPVRHLLAALKNRLVAVWRAPAHRIGANTDV